MLEVLSDVVLLGVVSELVLLVVVIWEHSLLLIDEHWDSTVIVIPVTMIMAPLLTQSSMREMR